MGYMTKHPLTLFALRLRKARLNSTIGGEPVRQLDLARILGVGHSTVWRWETGRQVPSANHMERVANALQMDEDGVWLDTYHLPPDMMTFLTTTREGKRVVENIRRIMTQLDNDQKPTTRRGIPEDATLRGADNTLTYRGGEWPVGPNHTSRRKKVAQTGQDEEESA